jgi:glutaredoxin-like protein NrdH
MELSMIVVFSKKNCPECSKAMALLDNKGVPYKIEKVDENPDARTFLLAMGHRAVPQMYKDSQDDISTYKEYVGDYKALTKLTDEQWAALK